MEPARASAMTPTPLQEVTAGREVERLWVTGRYDTQQIADRLKGLGPYMTEAFVYNWIVDRRLRCRPKLDILC